MKQQRKAVLTDRQPPPGWPDPPLPRPTRSCPHHRRSTRPSGPGHRTDRRRCPQPTNGPQAHDLDPGRPRLRNPADRPANPVQTLRHHDNPSSSDIDNTFVDRDLVRNSPPAPPGWPSATPFLDAAGRRPAPERAACSGDQAGDHGDRPGVQAAATRESSNRVARTFKCCGSRNIEK